MPKNIQLHHQPRLLTQHGAPGFGRSSSRSGVALAVAAVSAAVLSLTSCGVAPATQARTSDSTSTSPHGTAGEQSFQQALASLYSNNGSTVEMTGVALLVLENANKATGAQICLGVKTSLPPQCGGPKITNWSWEKVEGEESRNGVTWLDDVLLQGTFKNGEFTMTKPPQQGSPQGSQGPADEPVSRKQPPCPVPAGGWVAVDSAKADERSLSLTVDAQYTDRRARLKLPKGVTLGDVVDGFAGSAVFYPNAPAPDDGANAEERDDPMALTMYVAGDVAAATKEFRKTWGGPLCVAKVSHTLAQQEQIHREITTAFDTIADLKPLNVATSSVDHDGVRLSVMYGAKAVQAYLEERFSLNNIHVEAAFRPVTATSPLADTKPPDTTSSQGSTPATSSPPSTTTGPPASSKPAASSYPPGKTTITSPPAPQGELQTLRRVVWEDTKSDTGPLACEYLAESFPPQCHGVPITNWSWTDVKNVTENQGIKWTDSIVLRGNMSNGKLTLVAQP